MNVDVVVELAQEVLWLVLKLAAPPLVAALLAGLIASVLQAATSIQDATLSQVPKIVATALVLYVSFPWMLGELTSFFHRVLALVAGS